jgi:hypothetical protein
LTPCSCREVFSASNSGVRDSDICISVGLIEQRIKAEWLN